jgi:hypothetical protein
MIDGEFEMIALATSALPEQQRELVRCLVSEGRPPEEAAKLAGYHLKSVYRTLRLPAVAVSGLWERMRSEPNVGTFERFTDTDPTGSLLGFRY